MKKTLRLFVALSLMTTVVSHGQDTTWTYDFGTNSGSISGATTNTTLLPTTQEGGGSQYLRIGSGGGSFTLTNTGSGSQLVGVAPTSTSVNKFSIYNFSNPTDMFSVSFDVSFSGGSAGNWSFFAGNGTTFDSAGSNFNSADTFSGLRFQYGSSGSISVSNNNSGTWQAVSGTGIAQNSTYNISIFGNNSLASVSYLNSGTNALAANTYDLWVDGTKVASALSKSSLADLSLIDSFMFVGASSTGNVATLTLDNIAYANFLEAPEPPAPVVWTGTGVGGIWETGQQGQFSSPYVNSSLVGVEFSGTGETVTVSGALETGSLGFASTGFVLSGGTVTNAGGSVEVASGTTTIDSTVAGTNGMIKTGEGTLILSGNNSFVGNVVLNAGTLQIASDAGLGNAANDLALNGTLSTTSNVNLGADRDVIGAGIYDIAGGTTLTVNGSFANTETTLANEGTLDLQGATRSVGSLTLNAAGILNAAGAINATALTASGLTGGTATVNPDIIFTSGDKTLNVGAGGTVDLNGALSNGGGTGRIAKTGSGTLILSSANTMGGVRVGAAGPTPTDGGTVILENSTIGTLAQAIQLNTGTLSAASNLVFTNGISIGGRTNGAALLAGGNMEFQGSSAFFRGTDTSGELILNVNNSTTFSGGFVATSGGGTATGITIGGSGEVVIGGPSSTLIDTITLIDTVKLTLNDTIGGGLNVGASNVLGGNGTVLGSLSLASGAKFVFSLTETLTVQGSSVSFGGFGVADLIGLSSSTPNGVYTIIGGLATINTNNLLNFGAANAFVLGNGKSAYFSEGSLQLNVVPEPSTYALLALTGAGVAGYMIRRRRC